ncbi:MAG: DUF3108 domain-containing protein [Bacteroidales bacterium]
MKKLQLLGSLLLVLFFGRISAQEKTEQVFQAGEQLTYLAHFGIFNAGEATFSVERTRYDSMEVFHAVAKANTIGIADRIYEVRDVYESYFDMKTGLPYLAIRNINEGNYRYYNEVKFFHAQKSVLSQKSGEHEVAPTILDMVSAFYYLRNSLFEELSPGDIVVLDTFFADEVFPLKVRYKGIEKIKTKLGRFEVMRFVPVVEPGRIFDSEDDVTIWITNDKNFIPVQVRIDLIVGSIKCDLVAYEGLKYPLDAKK